MHFTRYHPLLINAEGTWTEKLNSHQQEKVYQGISIMKNDLIQEKANNKISVFLLKC